MYLGKYEMNGHYKASPSPPPKKKRSTQCDSGSSQFLVWDNNFAFGTCSALESHIRRVWVLLIFIRKTGHSLSLYNSEFCGCFQTSPPVLKEAYFPSLPPLQKPVSTLKKCCWSSRCPYLDSNVVLCLAMAAVRSLSVIWAWEKGNKADIPVLPSGWSLWAGF